jgi:hypothetical protein
MGYGYFSTDPSFSGAITSVRKSAFLRPMFIDVRKWKGVWPDRRRNHGMKIACCLAAFFHIFTGIFKDHKR